MIISICFAASATSSSLVKRFVWPNLGQCFVKDFVSNGLHRDDLKLYRWVKFRESGDDSLCLYHC